MATILMYLSSLVVLLILDAFWLGVAGGSLYADVLGDQMLNGFRVPPAAAFYLLHAAGIMVFVLQRQRVRGSLRAAAAYGAFFGICAYGTYDLTNFAVLRVWTWQITAIDMAWGAFVTAAAALAGACVERRMRKAPDPSRENPETQARWRH